MQDSYHTTCECMLLFKLYETILLKSWLSPLPGADPGFGVRGAKFGEGFFLGPGRSAGGGNQREGGGGGGRSPPEAPAN